jgi:hypothetical protein
MRGLKDFEGIVGKFSFDENGDSTLAFIYGYSVNDGKIGDATPISPSMQDTDCKAAS